MNTTDNNEYSLYDFICCQTLDQNKVMNIFDSLGSLRGYLMDNLHLNAVEANNLLMNMLLEKQNINSCTVDAKDKNK